ncbi:hypothetical protein M426DRAFT_23382 [Hypoxylon sp. CI-4A]|nr:hypothetical protein M426DRAFT_23382 [Hypoxylon sp. CI-4A]
MGIYDYIDSEKGEIRLLELSPAPEHSSPIECALRLVKLGDNPNFEALSYTWGGKGAGQHIFLNGLEFPVFENLEAVLRRLRYPNKPRTVWIDALCINQDDLEERASQVKLMRAVYETAVGVVIWLGEPSAGAELGLNRLTASNLATRSTRNREAHWAVERELFGNAGETTAEVGSWFSPSAERMRTELERDEIRELLCRPWWSRVWIMQEAVVARKLKILCGSWEFDWANLEAETKVENISTKQAALTRVMHPELLSFADSTFDDITQMRRNWAQMNTEGGGNNLYELLYKLRRLLCTDPRDRIFAFIGLLPPGAGSILDPIYSRTVEDVYTRFSRACMMKRKTLDTLNCTRQWRGVAKPTVNSRVYSVYERARYHDTSVMVKDDENGEEWKGSTRLPGGWERCMDDGVVTYFDHNTQTRHDESPMAGKVHLSSSRLERQTCPSGCQKTWDNLGRPSIKFGLVGEKEPTWFESDAFRDLPSWVPNWAARTSQDPEPLLNWGDEGVFHASGNSQAEVAPDMDDPVLSLAGLEFDTIEELAPAWNPESENPPLSRWGIKELEQWSTLALQDRPNCPYGDKDERLEALWRTHLGDYPGEAAAPPSDRIYVDLWLDQEGWVAPIGKIEPLDNFERGGADDAAYASRLLYDYWKKINGKTSWRNKLREIWDMWAVARHYVPFLQRIFNTCAHRALFVTSKGYIGLAPWNAQPGDKICLLKGGKTPFLLRELKKGESYEFVGESYVYGIMGGEAWVKGDGVELETFHIR